MITLSETTVNFIYNDLKARGIKEEGLLWEMVDHLCCIIEPQLKREPDFEAVYNTILSEHPSDIFKKIQHKVILNTNLKLLKMKKLLFIFGAVGTLLLFTGILFKFNHWPGAGISIFLGALTVVLGFLPLFFIVLHKEQEEKMSPIFSIAGYFTISLLVLGPLFKIMHWPGASALLFFGPMLLAVVFIPLYLVQVFRRSQKLKANAGYMLIIVGIAISSMVMLGSSRISNEVVEKYNKLYFENTEKAKMFHEKNQLLYAEFQGTTQAENTQTLRDLTDKINKQIELIKKDMLAKTGATSFEGGNQKYKDNKAALDDAMEHDQNEKLLRSYLNDYTNFIDEKIKDKFLVEVLKAQQETYILIDPNNKIAYRNVPFVEGFALLAQAEKQLNQSTYLILQHLNTQK